jgi:hypothetical protein
MVAWNRVLTVKSACMTRASRSTIAPSSTSRSARRWALPPLSPVAHRAQPSPRRGGGELAITELCAVMYAAGFSGKRGQARE